MADWWTQDAVIPSGPQIAAIAPAQGGERWWANDPVHQASAPAAAAPTGQDLSAPSGDPLGDLENMSPHGDMSAPLGDRARSMLNATANGVTLGFAPRIGAAFDAATGRAPSYADAIAGRNQDQTSAKADLGAAGYGMSELAGGAMLPFGLLGDAARGAGILGRTAIGAGTGAAMGGIGGAAGSTDLGDVGQTAAAAGKGAAMGAGLGAALPLAGGAVGGLVRYASPFVQPSPVEGMSRASFGLLNAANGPRVQAALEANGPEGMLLDAAPQMKGLAQGVATKPGDAQDLLADALTARNAGTIPRLQASVDQNLGPDISPHQFGQSMIARQDATGPMYETALNSAGPIDTSAVRQGLENDITMAPNRSTTQQRLNSFADYLRGPGTMPNGMPIPESDARVLQGAKFQMDADIARTEGQSGAAAMTATRQMVGNRNALADALAEQVPGFADANLAYGTAARTQEAFDRGRQVLNNGATPIRPDDYATHFETLPLEGQAAERAGARSYIGDQMGTKPNDLQALRQVVGGENDYNRGKMGTLFGADNAQNVIGDIDRNQMFRDNYGQIVHGSQTANKQAGSALIDAKSADNPIFPKQFSIPGLLLNTAERVGKGILGPMAERRADQVRMELARALSAQGEARQPITDPLAQALAQAGQGGQGVAAGLAHPSTLGAALALDRERRGRPSATP